MISEAPLSMPPCGTPFNQSPCNYSILAGAYFLSNSVPSTGRNYIYIYIYIYLLMPYHEVIKKRDPHITRVPINGQCSSLLLSNQKERHHFHVLFKLPDHLLSSNYGLRGHL